MLNNILDQLGFDRMEMEVIRKAMKITGDTNQASFVFDAVIEHASRLTGDYV